MFIHRDYYCNIKRITSRTAELLREYSINVQTFMALGIICHIAKLSQKDEKNDEESDAEVWNSRVARQEHGVTVPVSRPGTLLRHPQESNPEVIREVSVGCSERRRSLSREEEEERRTRQKMLEKTKEEKEEGRSDSLRFFLLLFDHPIFSDP